MESNNEQPSNWTLIIRKLFCLHDFKIVAQKEGIGVYSYVFCCKTCGKLVTKYI